MRPVSGSYRRLLILLAFIVFPALVAPTAASASAEGTGPATVASNSCGGVPVQSTASCTFVASGGRVRVLGTSVNPAYLTYGFPPLLMPGYASVTVKVTAPRGKLVTSCTAGGLAAAHCNRTSGGTVPAGTVLTCSVYRSGIGQYDCANAT